MTENENNFEPRDPQEAQLEVMLSEHLNARLGGQVGRASAAFSAAVHRGEVKKIRRTMVWIAGASAVAACVAVAALVLYRPAGNDTVAGGGPTETTPAPAVVAEVRAPGRMESTTYYRDLDGGVRMVSDVAGVSTPVREIRRQVVEETEWYDAEQKATIKVTMPREEVMYVQAAAF